MCSGWGLGTADFIGGTLTSHTDRLGGMALAARTLGSAVSDRRSAQDKICLASFLVNTCSFEAST